ncbi:hypothetical protein LCGC14_1892780 [marine sediment metagenome]|uniref:Uncharacterized protein n=1 Tax=marine sediment metagenome TaxID=412755 RepID=A0A0F9GM87_9ZZZZ
MLVEIADHKWEEFHKIADLTHGERVLDVWLVYRPTTVPTQVSKADLVFEDGRRIEAFNKQRYLGSDETHLSRFPIPVDLQGEEHQVYVEVLAGGTQYKSPVFSFTALPKEDTL